MKEERHQSKAPDLLWKPNTQKEEREKKERVMKRQFFLGRGNLKLIWWQGIPTWVRMINHWTIEFKSKQK